MINIINNLNTDNLILLAKLYCNTNFTKDEIEPLLPYLKEIYLDYYNNPTKRNYYINELKDRTSNETFLKIINILKKYNLI